ncbi:MAG: metal-dependent hydrolase [Candidatus Andeanibacterium colombiense]|uniref:Metal-dependent hydrolase n=1 Tax=Candidatus Andeanibacterium colombiense TaxID=3121345 RepID=A0AAJ5X7B6_9SPHN|nr:MAG: metal-dependent hydrolase [Sphingomonadaceae bacterium]
MDNLTHSLAGWTLGQTGLKKRSRKGLAALILGANAPDIDVFLGWVPWAPLATHRGFTHSFVGGVLLLPPMLAGLLWLLDRWQVRRGAQFASGLEMGFGWLLALSYIGCLTHPLLDWQTSYAIQLFTPFDRRWYHNDALFIIDPWLLLAMGWGIWLSWRREKRGQPRWARPAIVSAAAVMLYICANGALSAAVRHAPIVPEHNARPDAMVISPPPIAFWRRSVIWRQDHVIHFDEYVPGAGSIRNADDQPPIPDGMRDPLARRALRVPEMVSFARWSILPMARVTAERCRTVVAFQDARFGKSGEGRLGRSVMLPRHAAGCSNAR